MENDLFRSFISQNIDILNFIKYNTINKNKKEYFDYTASGLAFRQIETRLYEVLENYANTHSKESSNSDITSQYYEQARVNLHKNLEVSNDFIILPSGYGATFAIKHFQELLGLYIPPATKKRYKIKIDKKKLPLVIVGPYEHHSNEVTFREALCEIKRVNLCKNGLVDIKHLKKILEKNKNREIIGSFCIASNVTGIITPYKKISKILKSYNAIVCFDAASSSSYINIPSNLYDVMFLSAHKLLGGPGSCGLLVIKKDILNTKLSPTFSGGGTVTYVDKSSQNYQKNIIHKETYGTPGILQFIKASLCYQLRNEIGLEFIKKRKKENLKYFINQLKNIKSSIIYGNQKAKNIGIVSFNINNINPYDLCRKLSNISNIQTRAGCSCAGPYGHDLLGEKTNIKNKPQWLRVSIHFSHTHEEIDKLIDSIKESINS